MIIDCKDEIKQLRAQGLSLYEIAEQLAPKYPDKTERQLWDMAHSATRSKKSMDEKPVGVFSDPHIPFNHPNYLQFCVDTFKKYGVGQVVCCGDLVDNHAISRHQTETCAKSPYDELDMSIKEVAKYTAAFPKVKMVLGNHDLIAVRQAATLGLGERFLKPLHELLGLPKTWELADEFIINDVLYQHGINCGGENGAINKALKERMSTVIGHSHSRGGVRYKANKRDLIFGLDVGCGIDIAAYAFAYGTHCVDRPMLGCGIVFDSQHAEFVPMSANYFRD